MEECSCRQDKIVGPDSEDDQESLREKQVKVCFVRLCLIIDSEACLNYVVFCFILLFIQVCMFFKYVHYLSNYVYGNEYWVNILSLIIYFV